MKLKSFWLLLLLTPALLMAQENGKISGYMFGDYYYVAANHNSELENRNGFWFRRIYFTYDQNLSDAFAIRLRMELASPGNFTSSGKITPFVKDAYLSYKFQQHKIYIGLSPTPTWERIEKIWGYRSVEKTPLDLQKFGSSRDFGVAIRGSLDKEKRVNYHVMLGNGSGTGTETNEGKKVMLSLAVEPVDHVVVEGYVDFEERPGKTNRYTFQGFAAYQDKNFRLGVQFAHQTREQGTGLENLDLQIFSAFAAAKVSDRTWAFVRFDRMFDANPNGAKISYIPFDPTSKSTFFLGGLDFRPLEKVHLMPNFEAVFYDENNIDTDVIPRFTFYYKF
ncbi:MAG: hypothetical protein D6813_15655 [Calditrichaeota bacterium]|nr:MAG: hypothetical protein D6813_15655 [Calditrichota bacterium]